MNYTRKHRDFLVPDHHLVHGMIPVTASSLRNAILQQMFAHLGVTESTEIYHGVEQYSAKTRTGDLRKKPHWCALFSTWAIRQVSDHAGVGRLIPPDSQQNETYLDQHHQKTVVLRDTLKEYAPNAVHDGKNNDYSPKPADLMLLQETETGRELHGHASTVVSSFKDEDGLMHVLTIDGNIRNKDIKLGNYPEMGAGQVQVQENIFNPETGEADRVTSGGHYKAAFVNLEKLPNFVAVEQALEGKEPYRPVEPKAMISPRSIVKSNMCYEHFMQEKPSAVRWEEIIDDQKSARIRPSSGVRL